MKSASQCGLAVVTGAAGGLGSSFAYKLAERGYRLLLIDRRHAQLEQVCEAITERYGVSAESYAADLCKREEIERLAERLERMEEVELLVNNAGFGAANYFADTDVRLLVGMVDVHVTAPTFLTRAVLPGMIERNSGTIINVSSVSAWLQSAGNAQYGATKNYLAMFTLALQQELLGTKVRVQALCPGFIRTEFHDAEGMQGFDDLCAPGARMWMAPDDVAEYSLCRLSSRQVLAVPGLGYRVAGRLAQMPFFRPLMQWITRVPRVAPCAPQPAESRSMAELSSAEGA